MKKKTACIIVAAVLAAILLLPHKTVYRDGGTRDYRAILYRVVVWNRMNEEGIYHNMDVYFFPHNRRSIDQLWEEKAEKLNLH